MEENVNHEKLLRKLIITLVVAYVLVVFVFGIYFYLFHGNIINNSKEEWGQFGDFIGGTLNPLLSFLSLLALLLTIILQSKELVLSKKELELTREELKRSATAQEETQKVLDKQYETQVRQQFENTFFTLLEQHNKLLKELSENVIYTNAISAEYLSNAFEAVTKSNCKFYFMFLYQILEFIALNVPNSNVKSLDNLESNTQLSLNEKMYGNIVKSFLNHKIITLLAIKGFYIEKDDTNYSNSQHKISGIHDNRTFKYLIERYALLEHIDVKTLKQDISPNNENKQKILLTQLKNYYDKSAFGSNPFFNDTINN